MRFACEQCQTKYSIPDERVRGKILKIRCKTCGCLISVSEAGARTSRVGEPAADPGQSTAGLDLRDQLASEGGGGGDATMIGGMADFFGKLPGTESAPSDDWHLSIDGNQEGPFALDNLAQRILDQAGTSAELYVWHEGFDGWKLPDSVPDVQTAVTKARTGVKAPAKITALGKDSGPSAKDGAKSAAKAGAKVAAKDAAKPAAKAPAKPVPSLASSEDAGDATQIGSLDIPSAKGSAKADDDEVQDASLLMLGDDAFDALLDRGSGKAAAKPTAKPTAKPPAKPTPPLPGAKAAPPAFKAPPALSRTLPLGSQFSSGVAKPTAPASQPAPASAPAPALAPTPAVVVAPLTPEPVAAPPAVSPTPSPPAVQIAAGLAEPPAAQAPPAASALADLSLTPPPASAAFGVVPNADLGTEQSRSGEGKRGSKAWLALLLLLLVGGGGAAYWFILRPQSTKPQIPTTSVADAGADAGAPEDAGSKSTPTDKPTGPNVAAGGDVTELPMSVLEDLLKSGHSALDKCYAKSLKKNKSLDGAKLKAVVDVADKGKASHVELTGPDTDGKLGKCVQKALKKWKYPRQKDDYKTTFTLTVKEKE